jgi:glycine amidinotransferase
MGRMCARIRPPHEVIEMPEDEDSQSTCPVNSHNEWDPLEEVVVGILDGAANLTWEIGLEAVTAVEHLERSRSFHLASQGTPVPPLRCSAAQRELDDFVHVLEAEGVKVRRPDPINHARPITTPAWSTAGGNCQANPRDVLIVFGDEILEAPMAWRSRYFEFWGYRSLCKEYFKAGAKWTAAPKPQMLENSYDYGWERGQGYVTTEFEPLFDAADMVRCGKDIIIQRSHVTNDMGIDWIERHLGDEYRVHRVEFDDYRAIHIDATFVPLRPGTFLVNPDRPMRNMPAALADSGWEFLEAPRSTLPESHPWYHSFRWLSMNMLNIDEKRVIVEASEEPTIQALKEWGFEPIPVAFRNNYPFGGSFHCATVDIRRRGGLRSYID